MADILLQFGNDAVSFAATLIVHSTVILILGLSGLYFSRRHMAYASLILRLTVAAVLLTPLSSYMFSKYGVLHFSLPGISVEELAVIQTDTDVPPPGADRETPYNKTIQNSRTGRNAAVSGNGQGVYPSFETEKQPRKPVGGVSSPSFIDIPITPGKNSERRTRPAPETPAGFEARRIEPDTQAEPPVQISRQADRSSKANGGLPFELLYSAFAFLWTVFSAWLFIKILVALKHIASLKKEATPARFEIQEECGQYAEILGIGKPPVLMSHDVSSAFLTGIVKPAIFIPFERPGELVCSREILVHELAHLKRNDTLWNMLGQAGKIMIPFQPLMWMLDKQMKITSDFICDDVVLHVTKSRKLYAEQLYQIAEEGCLMAVQAAASVGFFTVDSSFLARIERILDRHRQLSYSLNKRHLIVTVVFGSIGFVSVGFMGIRAGNAGLIPKNIINLTAAPVQRSAPHVDKADTGTIEVTEPERTTASHLPSGDDASYTQRHYMTTETESPLPFSRKVENIRQIMDSADMDSSPIEIRFHAGKETDIDETREFISSIISESERDLLTPDTCRSLENLTLAKAEYGYSGNLFDPGDIAGVSPAFSASSVADLAIAGNYDIRESGTEQTFKALDVRIPSEYEYGDLSDPERTRLSDFYRSLRKDKLYPVWSPDGTKIAFNDRDYAVWVVNADGGEPNLVFDNYYKLRYEGMKLHYGKIQTIGFSPDGKEVAYRRYRIDINRGTRVTMDDKGNMAIYFIENPLPVIESVNIETLESRILAEDAITGNWSPDGGSFAYISQDLEGHRELWLLDTADNSRRGIFCESPSTVHFTPDGASMLVTCDKQDGSREIVSIDAQNGDITETLLDGAISVSDISPDGRWMLFSEESAKTQPGEAAVQDNYRPLLFDLHSGVIHDISTGDRAAASWGQFSPDGGKLCLSLKDNSAWNIYIQDFKAPGDRTFHGQAEIPQSYSLIGNSPNPFNMSTTIEYSVADEINVSLYVYNSLGQKVRELVSGPVNAGVHTAVWDGRDDDGNSVSTGMYIAKLNAGVRTSTLKMTVMK